MGSRTIVIGDVHGCYDEAIELLGTVGATSSDRVIFTGDLIDRGPKRRECVELAMRHESVLGNHEEKLLQQLHRADDRLLPDHLESRRTLEPRHLEWLRALPHFICLPEHNAAVIHAGALPSIPLEQQDPYHLLHAQCVRPPGKKSYWPSKAPADFSFWTHHWKGPQRLIFGHTVFDQPLVTEHAVGLDTGAVYGGALTAVVLPEWRIVSVPARRAYYGGKRVGRYPVGGVNAFS